MVRLETDNLFETSWFHSSVISHIWKTERRWALAHTKRWAHSRTWVILPADWVVGSVRLRRTASPDIHLPLFYQYIFTDWHIRFTFREYDSVVHGFIGGWICWCAIEVVTMTWTVDRGRESRCIPRCQNCWQPMIGGVRSLDACVLIG